jgi:general secretion pathway protein D
MRHIARGSASPHAREPVIRRTKTAAMRTNAIFVRKTAEIAAALLIACSAMAQTAPANPTDAPAQPTQPVAQANPTASQPSASPAQPDKAEKPAKQPSTGDKRRAAKLFLQSSKLFENERYEEAMAGYQKASDLDPTNKDYLLAAEVARSHAATALVQLAARARMKGDSAGARAALERALALDPNNPQVTQHIEGLADQAAMSVIKPLYDMNGDQPGEPLPYPSPPGAHSFHLRASQRQLIQQVFKDFGVDATVDDSVRSNVVHFDVDDATFPQCMRALSMLTNTFYVPLDPRRVLVAKDSAENRSKFVPLELETIYLSGLSAADLTEVANVARNVFEVSQVNADQSADKLTVRAPHSTMAALNETLRNLIDGRDQVLLEVRLIQLAHTSERNTGTQLPQTITAFNVYAQEQQILNANSSLVQQIISQGLAAPGDTAAIIAILIASGQVSSSLFSNGILLFGNGLTLSGLQPQPITMNFALNSSDSRELDQIELRLGDGEAGTIRTGEKYPILQSSFSGLNTAGLNIPGLTSAGSSSALGGLSGLLGGLASSTTTVPQVQYQDLGLTLKATPKVLRSGDVALTLDMKIDALGGSSIDNIPILDNRAYTGVVTLPEGQSLAVVSELDKQESLAISGAPGLSEIPGLNDITDKDKQSSYSSLLIVMTPHIVRGTQLAGHTPMMRIEPAVRGRS